MTPADMKEGSTYLVNERYTAIVVERTDRTIHLRTTERVPRRMFLVHEGCCSACPWRIVDGQRRPGFGNVTSISEVTK